MMQDSLICNTVDPQKEEYVWCLCAFSKQVETIKNLL